MRASATSRSCSEAPARRMPCEKNPPPGEPLGLACGLLEAERADRGDGGHAVDRLWTAGRELRRSGLPPSAKAASSPSSGRSARSTTRLRVHCVTAIAAIRAFGLEETAGKTEGGDVFVNERAPR